MRSWLIASLRRSRTSLRGSPRRPSSFQWSTGCPPCPVPAFSVHAVLSDRRRHPASDRVLPRQTRPAPMAAAKLGAMSGRETPEAASAGADRHPERLRACLRLHGEIRYQRRDRRRVGRRRRSRTAHARFPGGLRPARHQSSNSASGWRSATSSTSPRAASRRSARPRRITKRT